MDTEKKELDENREKKRKKGPILLFFRKWKEKIAKIRTAMQPGKFSVMIKEFFTGRAKLEAIDYFIISAIMLGTILLIYPTIGDLYSRWKTMQSMDQYNQVVDEMDNKEIEDELERARKYNKTLWGTYYTGIGPDEEDGSNPMKEGSEEYNDILNITKNGVIGYLIIDKINSYSTIYHGSTDSVLAVGAGHLFSTGLPVDGPNVHGALSAHTGLASATLFTDLDQIEVGDSYEIHILNKVFTYQVEQILIVDPDNISELQIEYGSNFVTLITCYPYGINSHRLLVRGRLQGYNYNRDDYEDYFEYEDIVQEEEIVEWEEESGEQLTQTGIEWLLIGKIAKIGVIVTGLSVLLHISLKRKNVNFKLLLCCKASCMVGIVILLVAGYIMVTSLIEEYAAGKMCTQQMQELKLYFEDLQENANNDKEEETTENESELSTENTEGQAEKNESSKMRTITIGKHSYIGKLSIPEINVEVPVMEECSSENLKISPCVDMGTIADENLVIAGHRYGEIFGSLSKLQAGDKIYLTTVENKTYTYMVKTGVEIMPRKKDLYYGYQEWDLAIYTCTLGGTRRHVIYAELMEE